MIKKLKVNLAHIPSGLIVSLVILLEILVVIGGGSTKVILLKQVH